jgi:hypothetical protein
MKQHSVRSGTKQSLGLSGRELSHTDLDQVSGGVVAPRDAATGQATGRRIERPVFVTTPVGMAS